jgi:hypothetical protein
MRFNCPEVVKSSSMQRAIQASQNHLFFGHALDVD